MGSSPGEDRDICKRVVPLRHGGILKSYRAARPLVRLIEEEGRWNDHHSLFFLKIGVESSQIVLPPE
ncbi:hypothetical protein TNCV_1033551 [Trichonephila clavipes]|nr:hypothetical protein TNCV_1033551 [Trichonephila clavipes]